MLTVHRERSIIVCVLADGDAQKSTGRR